MTAPLTVALLRRGGSHTAISLTQFRSDLGSVPGEGAFEPRTEQIGKGARATGREDEDKENTERLGLPHRECTKNADHEPKQEPHHSQRHPPQPPLGASTLHQLVDRCGDTCRLGELNVRIVSSVCPPHRTDPLGGQRSDRQ